MIDVVPVKPPWWRRALLPLVLLALFGGAAWYVLMGRGKAAPEVVAKPTDVRSDITRSGDSLDVAVVWELTSASTESVPESVRVEVGLSDTELASVSVLPSTRREDTLRIAGPAPGGTASGYSCVSSVHRGRLLRESCTPWQFVLPSAEQMGPSDTGAQAAEPAAPRVLQIVVQPSGLQVDPDIDGRCAEWQRRHPSSSVWLGMDINQRAVAECMGPNGKPTVAQFCAFAVLADGRRVQTQNSLKNPYCARLFEAWSEERIS